MRNKPERIILDTNLWISFLISKDLAKLDKILFSGKCRLVFSEELMQEFLQVAKPLSQTFLSNAPLLRRH
jgi:putative PIN family toxin of toxin-antitoxin system